MGKKARENVLLERFRKAGLSPIPERQGEFSFAISPTTAGIDTNESSRLARGFRAGLLELIGKMRITSPMRGMTIFPQIMDPHIAQLPEMLKYKRKEKAVFVGVNIPFSQWMTASAADRVDLLAANLVASISRIPSKYISPQDRDALIAAVEQVRISMKAKALH